MQHLTTNELLANLATRADLSKRELVLVDRLTSAIQEIEALERDILELEQELVNAQESARCQED